VSESPSAGPPPQAKGEPRPLLGFAAPRTGPIPPVTGSRPYPPTPQGPGAVRQGARLTPRFQELEQALAAERVTAGAAPTDPDPELVVVFDLAGTIEGFARAVAGVQGLEFLAELDEGQADPDDDFYTVTPNGQRSDGQVNETAYLALTNTQAVTQLISLFQGWQADENARFPRGLTPLRDAFRLLRDVRRWGPADRIRDTGLLERWQEEVAVVGNSGVARIEVELWFRSDPARRAAAQAQVAGLITQAGGQVRRGAVLPEIGYHALLAELPHPQVEAVLAQGPGAIELLTTGEVMLVSPVSAMTVLRPDDVAAGDLPQADGELPSELPLVGLLDAVPLANHDLLAGRLVLDDPDGFGARYPSASQQRHGTGMASLITHGDLDAPGPPLPSRLYVRPLLGPHPFYPDAECVPDDELLVDLLHRAFHRMFKVDGQQPPAAPSVRIVNLSIGDPARVFVRRLSPLAKLLDWFAYHYNLLILVSAGNHDARTTVPAAALDDPAALSRHLLADSRGTALHRRLLSPAEAVNVLTVGATHADSWSGTVPGTVLDAAEPDLPAPYGAVGAGHRRSVKPDILLPGGRGLYLRPPPGLTGDVDLTPVPAAVTGPGHRVAAPDPRGGAGATAYTYGTSDATALATRASAMVMRQLEQQQQPQEVDWDDSAARAELIDSRARDGYPLLAVLDGRELGEGLAEAAALLATVLGQDLETTQDGTFRIARRVAKDRVISTVDPQARHGHKTQARGFDGYKGHVAADPDSEIITDTEVSAGNVGDAAVAADLIDDLLDRDPGDAGDAGDAGDVYGDAAYGSGEFQDTLAQAGISSHCKTQPPSAPAGRFAKDQFDIDLERATVSCPNGQSATIRRGKDGDGTAYFGPACNDCPLRAQCTDARDGRTVAVGRYEQRLADARQQQKDPAWVADYRATRPKVERKLGHLMRRKHGGRRARMRGKIKIDADFNLLAAAHNLARLAVLNIHSTTTGWAVATA